MCGWHVSNEAVARKPGPVEGYDALRAHKRGLSKVSWCAMRPVSKYLRAGVSKVYLCLSRALAHRGCVEVSVLVSWPLLLKALACCAQAGVCRRRPGAQCGCVGVSKGLSKVLAVLVHAAAVSEYLRAGVSKVYLCLSRVLAHRGLCRRCI